MSAIGVLGVLIGLLAARFVFTEWTRLRIGVFAVTYLFHLIATFAYYSFSLANPTDASMYYYDYNNFYLDIGWGYGTLFITSLVQAMKTNFGGTFLDYFLLFQAISFFGICLIMRTIDEIYRELELEQPLYTYALTLLPGIHFWTSPIGKDGFLLLGVALTVWAAMNFRKRYLAMAAGLVVMLVVRPYIAPLGLVALAGTIFFDSRTRLSLKVVIAAVSIVGLGFSVASIEESFGVDVTDADSISERMQIHEDVTAQEETGGGSAVYGSYPFRLMSLLFRPMFIDAENVMGLAASVENVILLVLIGTILVRLRTTMMLARRLSYMRFALMIAVAIMLTLAIVYYNIGLGLRQKTMFMPAVIVIFVTLMALGRAQRFIAGALAGQPTAAAGGGAPALSANR